MKNRCFTITVLMCLLVLNVHPASAKDIKEDTLRTIRIGVGYIPNVQFAPIYVAQKKGFYQKEGLDVEVEYGFENDFVLLAAKGERECSLASSDQIILARTKGIPITYVMKWHHRYPVAVASPISKKITSMKDLIGKRVGIPGFYGASYIGWKALVHTSGIDEKDVILEQIGFTQVAAIQQDIVDAAVVYIVNEPVQLRNAGIEVNVIEVSDKIKLVSNGLVVGEKLIKTEPELVQSIVKATLQGLVYTVDHGDEAFEISRAIIPEMTEEAASVQRQVLEESIELIKCDRPGFTTEQEWKDSADFMLKAGLIDKPVELNTLYTNQFLK